MAKGPRLNNISKTLTTRDSLGIENVATSISGEICPIVNTVTPRPFYWALINWCFYDFYHNCDPNERNINNVYKYVKRQNYFMALACMLNNKEQVNGFSGTDNIKSMETDLTKSTFKYNEKYLKTLLSNMGYYPSGLLSMGFIVEETQNNEKLKYPIYTESGERLALAFDKVISKTEYYKTYRLTGLEVPNNVLVELGKVVNVDLDGFDEVKEILREFLFNKNRTKKLIESHEYIKFLYYENSLLELDREKCREAFFDYFSPLGEYKKNYPVELKTIINEWEIVIGRQYFTAGLEMIWKYMVETLNTPKTYKEWFSCCLDNSTFSININDRLISILSECNYSFADREKMISLANSKNNDHLLNVENGIKIILSIYNRFNSRSDFSEDDKKLFSQGNDNESISLQQFFLLIEEYKEKSIIEFIEYIMHNYLLSQHLRTAFEKMLQGRDGYFIEKFDDKYIRKEYFYFDFQGIRAIQLMAVMKDLDILEVK